MEYSDAEIGEVVDALASLVAGGKSVDGAIASQKWTPKPLLASAKKEYERQLGIIAATDPAGIVADRSKAWYKPPVDGRSWKAVKDHLESTLPAAAVIDVDQASTKVVSLGAPPGRSPINTKGLVLGYVQSGKTTNFTSVIAKAADVGYRLVIILTGITENLRCQTQDRINQALIESTNALWHPLTTIEQDFSADSQADALLQNTQLRLIAVVKKNPARLRRLRNWIDNTPSTIRDACPILVIDDEADQASVDTGTKRRSTINGLILDILKNNRAQYLAYTATPFANLLINAENTDDLYPKDFIFPMREPEGYFGARAFFGLPRVTMDGHDDDGFDLVRSVPLEEAQQMRPPKGVDVDYWQPKPQAALQRSLMWFVLATAARRVKEGERHSSMLVHTTMNSAAHFPLGGTCEAILRDFSNRLSQDDDVLIDEMEDLWEQERKAVEPSRFGNAETEFDQILERLPRVLQDAEVVIDNYRSRDRLYYRDDSPRTVVVVGGNTMSRGLTLEGLTCSYFVRSASAYDTLLQMGRWFGFRRGYEHLVRVWTTPELGSWFRDLAGIEQEIRDEIEVYQHESVTPLELPVRIRSHPAMTITSAAKMKQAKKVAVSYSGRAVQTTKFHQHDAAWLLANIHATQTLVRDSLSDGAVLKETNFRRSIHGVSSLFVLRFLENYQVAQGVVSFQPDSMREYIEKEVRTGSLITWNVAFIEPSKVDPSDLDFGFGPVRLGRRSRLRGTEPELADLKAIASTGDRIRDMDITIADVRKYLRLPTKPEPKDEQFLAARTGEYATAGLLCIYPIAKDSKPADAGGERVPLTAVEHIVGVTVFFPRAKDPSNLVEAYQAIVPVPDFEDDIDEAEAADAYDEDSEAGA